MGSVAKRPTKAPADRPDQAPIPRLALLVGKDAFLRAAYTDEIAASVRATGADAEVLRFDGATASVADVLDECRSVGLLAQHKLVVVDDADEFVKHGEDDDTDEAPSAPVGGRGARASAAPSRRAMLERYAQSPPDGATLVLRAETWRKGKLDAMITAVGVIRACDPLSPPLATRAAVKLAKDRHARVLEPDAAERLIELTGVDLQRIASELAKLDAAAPPGAGIDAALVEALVAPAALDLKPWIIQESLLSPDPRPGLDKLRELLDRAGADPVPVRWAYLDLAIKLHSISREVAQGTAPAAAGRSLRLWGPVGEALRRVAPRADPRALARLLHDAVEADARGKTGQGDPERGLELLTLRFASALARSADTHR